MTTLIEQNKNLALELYFGGTFSPIHFGHLQPLLEIAEPLAAEKIYLLPNGHPPHRAKPDVADKDRYNMCQLATQVDPRLAVDDRELNAKEPEYTINTLKALRAEKPEASLVFVIGMDSLNTIDTWLDWTELTQYAHLIVLQRGGCPIDLKPHISAWIEDKLATNIMNLKQKKSGLIYLSQSSALQISSSFIRSRYKLALNNRCLLPESVNKYIMTNQLYQN